MRLSTSSTPLRRVSEQLLQKVTSYIAEPLLRNFEEQEELLL